MGEALYKQIYFFADPELLVDSSMQNRIKEFQYCKAFSCPPYPVLADTPYQIVDDFFVIEEEYTNFINKKQEENNGKN